MFNFYSSVYAVYTYRVGLWASAAIFNVDSEGYETYAGADRARVVDRVLQPGPVEMFDAVSKAQVNIQPVVCE